MRRWACFMFLLGIAMPGWAAVKSLSVEQMEKLLGTLQGKPDGKVASALKDVQLTERVSLARFTRWEAEFPGKHSHEELMKLADLSAFLEPPAADATSDPAPSSEAQRHMLWMALQYVSATTPRLPNLEATRQTVHFENTQPEGMDYAASSRRPTGLTAQEGVVEDMTTAPLPDSVTLQNTGEFSRMINYRDGREVQDIESGGGKKEQEPSFGLTTSGEFGPILETVMGDAMRGGFRWLRWEKGASVPVAEFLYSVPQAKSHYRVAVTSGINVEVVYPAYHGEIEINPATGAILRLTVLPALEPPHDNLQAKIAVEYAPVSMGDRSYICPVRGMAYTKLDVRPVGLSSMGAAVAHIKLNDVTFSDYRLFATEPMPAAAP